jgi:hypothetical protein
MYNQLPNSTVLSRNRVWFAFAKAIWTARFPLHEIGRCRCFFRLRKLLASCNMFAITFAIVSFTALTEPALANLRDSVMSRAFACGAIGDSRRWLDCFYGSAQPIRASLGLISAPQEQIALAASPPAGPVTNAEASFRENILYSAMDCRSIVHERDWLNCFYSAARAMRERLGLQSTDSSTQPSQSDRQSIPLPQLQNAGQSNSFGLRTVSGSDPLSGSVAKPISSSRKISSIESQMTSYSFDDGGIFTVVLANGKTWRQISGDTSYADWKGPAGKYLVRISRGFLGSFNLTVKGYSAKFKVERLR